MKSKIKTERFHIVMPTWLLDSIKIDAEKLGVSTSDYIRDILKSHQKQNELLKECFDAYQQKY